jgi:hypothetical protein
LYRFIGRTNNLWKINNLVTYMRFFLSFIPLLAPFCFMLCSNPRAIFADEKEIIIWQENRPLAWDDFQGKPQKRFAAASTH